MKMVAAAMPSACPKRLAGAAVDGIEDALGRRIHGFDIAINGRSRHADGVAGSRRQMDRAGFDR